MSKLSKGYFATLKGKKVTFLITKSLADVKVKLVSIGGDYKFKKTTNSSFSKETIKVQIVTSGEDVKLQESSSGDFEVYFK